MAEAMATPSSAPPIQRKSLMLRRMSNDDCRLGGGGEKEGYGKLKRKQMNKREGGRRVLQI